MKKAPEVIEETTELALPDFELDIKGLLLSQVKPISLHKKIDNFSFDEKISTT